VNIVRVYHGGRDASHRERERALQSAGTDVTLVIPASWPERGAQASLSAEHFRIIEVPVERAGDVNRHAYPSREELHRLIDELKPDILDLHEEPVSVAARQWLAAVPPELPVVMYTAQNVDKRYPPPFSLYERRAYRRVAALYPCSRQAASVARGKGFTGDIDVIPLGYDPELFYEGEQSLDDDQLVLALLGRLVPEKGVRDAVHVVARVNAVRPARLVVAGSGPEAGSARKLAEGLGIADRVEIEPWRLADELAELYRRAHLVLVPSVATATWVEQFGRVIVEAHASGAVIAGYASGSIPEVAGDAAVLADAGATAELADRVVALLDDPGEYGQLRERGLALSRTRTWAQVAERQAELYRRVAEREIARISPPRSPRRRRAAARAEFGPTAATTAGARPFALPLLRRGGAVAVVLATVIDAIAEVMARFRATGIASTAGDLGEAEDRSRSLDL
jgi:glycosyltransferase involved in cell wall biosynthesis